MDETSRSGPEGECSNSHRPRVSFCSTLHICSAAVCKEQGGRCCSIAAVYWPSAQAHCSCVLPGALFSFVWWFGLQLRTSDSWLSGVAANHEEGPVPVAMYMPSPWTRTSSLLENLHRNSSPIPPVQTRTFSNSCPGVQPLCGARRQGLC